MDHCARSALPAAPALYLVTPDGWSTARLLAACDLALGAGAQMLQYRNKSGDHALRLEQASSLARLCRQHGRTLIINDDVALAVQVHADGVHLGEFDGSVAQARAALGPAAIIGASCYDEPQMAQQAVADGASYIAFGAFFPSPTKPQARRATLQLLQAASQWAVPTCAIGGITETTAEALVAAGADLIAVVSAVFEAADPAQATLLLLDRMAAGLARRKATRQIPH